MTQDELKSAVALEAVNYIKANLDSDSVIGIGTGSTANFFIDHLAELKHTFDGAVASSEATAERLKSHGILVHELNSVAQLDYYIDGADECNERLELIKGGGGALTREKVVAAVANEFICIVDASKQVQMLGTFPLPVEVLPMARSYVARELVKIGGDPVWREDFTTDNGNVILDVHNMRIQSPIATEEQINQITGVVTNGLFAVRPANVLLVGTKTGVQTIKTES